MSRWVTTHTALREAALAAFSESGYDATSTADVAARAGVSEMTLFRHFPTKESLLLADPYDPLMADAVRVRPADESAMRALVEGMRSAWRSLPDEELEGLRHVLQIVAATRGLDGALERSSADTLQALAHALEERGIVAAAARAAAAAVIAGLSRALLDAADLDTDGLRESITVALDVLVGM